ncbi:hypothetical protein L6164_013998 [Bauhinia variegata]|uniref:Uncharacterized protein n=1 Tax=Bauhinia variegata TaxID=167791 RepID=A0ACB9NHY8_BAUVA|nr:hypothetical protein L6164_013998 [Bauhinia variegata]
MQYPIQLTNASGFEGDCAYKYIPDVLFHSTALVQFYSSLCNPARAQPSRGLNFTFKTKPSRGTRRRKMWFVYVCDESKKELGRQQAPGSCPFCGGKVEATDVEIKWRLCFLPMFFKIKRKYFCTLCAKRLELYY